MYSKPGGEDLANWSMKELKDVVVHFQKMCSKEPETEKQAEVEAEKRKSVIENEKKELIDHFL